MVTLVMLVVAAPFDASVDQPILRIVGGSLGMLPLFGFPVLIVFGLPKPFATPIRRGVTLAALIVLFAAVLSASIPAFTTQALELSSVQAAIAIPLSILVISPFFVATSMIGDARRACGYYLTGDVIQSWVGVFTYPYLGVFLIQGQIALLVENVSGFAAENELGNV